MTVEPTDGSEGEPEPPETVRLLKRIDRGISLLIAVLLAAAALFGYSRWVAAQEDKGKRDADRFSQCIAERIDAGQSTEPCHRR